LKRGGVFVVSCGGMCGNAGGLAAVSSAQKNGTVRELFSLQKKRQLAS
jgi:hypothetical protein